MGYTIKQLRDEPILLIEAIDPVDPDNDLPRLYHDTEAMIATIPGMIYRIVDLSKTHLDFFQVVELLAVSKRSGGEGSMYNPRLKTIYVVSDEMSSLLADSVHQQQYGAVQAETYTSVDDAIRFAQHALASV